MQWSFSSLSTYEQCPLKYWHEKLSGNPPAPPGRAAARGNRVHEQVEEYLLGTRPTPPKEFSTFNDELNGLIDHNALPEMEMAFSQDWGESDWDHAWVRGKLDAVVPEMGLVIDFKTGRYYPKHRDQAELYALMSYKKGLDQDGKVDCEFWYVDLDDVTLWTFPVSQMEAIQERWEARAAKLDEESEWRAKPNRFCKWCSYRDECPEYDGDA